MKKFIVVSLFLSLIIGVSMKLHAVTVTIGSGTNCNTATGSPTPYGTYYKNFRQQYLLTANELGLTGGGGGNITSLSFNVDNVNNCSAMPNYRIRLKHTTTTSFTSTAFETGNYDEVWSSTNYIPNIGWNQHTFVTPFNWDGTSNIIVDIVTTMLTGSTTQNSSVYYTATTGTNTCKLYQSNTEDAGAYSGIATTISVNRANMKFEMAAPHFSETPVNLQGVYHSSVAWGDYDNDNDLDIVLTGQVGGPVSKIYRNDGNNTFTDIVANLTAVYYSSVAWGDYDNDGDLDLLLTGAINDRQGVSKIYRNDGNNTFTDINAALTGVSSSSAAWGDYDNDGDLDILITGGVEFDDVRGNSNIYRNNGNGNFSLVASLIGVVRGSVAWGDYDNDGDLDILLTGYNRGYISRILRNDGNNIFTNIYANLLEVNNGSVAWGDYDNDGDLDVLLTGYNNGATTKIYRNDGQGTFTDVNAGLTGIHSGSVAWGDFDNDGDLDILLTGDAGNSYNITRIYCNDGNGSFANMPLVISGVRYSSVAWGDYDCDGDIDILLTGYSLTSKVYRNDCLAQNTAPEAPSNLRASFNGDYVNFLWDNATDAQSSASALSYVLKIGTTPGSTQIAAPMASTSGYRLIPVSGYSNSEYGWKIASEVIQGNATCYWSVQAIDGGYLGSPFSYESSFQRLRLIAPNGGENWQATSNRTVYWSAASEITNVNVLLSIDNGSNWIMLNPYPVAASLGRFSFTIPSLTASQCLIKVISTTDSNLYDVSDNTFVISSNSPTNLYLTAPINSKLQSGKNYDITWVSSGVSDVMLDYSIDSGVNWYNIASSIPASPNSFNWTVPETPATTCYIRVTDSNNTTVYDWSDEPFTICSLSLISPNGGEMFQTGSTINITWASEQLSSVLLEYTINNGSSWTQIISSTAAGTGTYNWIVPTIASDQYQIRISDVADNSISDNSDALSTIASLALSYPNAAGIKLQAGRDYNVNWSQAFLPGTVKLEYSTIGTTYITIATAVDATLGTFLWTVPDTPSTTCKIRITSEVNALILDSSDNNFTISRINLSTPNGNEIWGSGSQHAITWTFTNVTNVKLEYSTDDGSNWIQIVASVASSTGTYSWTVPTANSTLCRVRVSDAASSIVFDTSDVAFTIRPQIIVSSPNGAEYLTVNSIHSILWSITADLSFVMIDYSINNGTTWLPIQTSAYPATVGRYDWIVPNNPSPSCLVKVRSSTDIAIYDISDAVFTITNSLQPPIVNFSAELVSGLEPLTVQFTDQSIACTGNLTDWLWEFGDGESSTQQNPLHVYLSDGVYSVSLTATNSAGLNATLTMQDFITVIPRYPVIEVAVNSLNLGNVYLGSSSTIRELWIYNTGNAVMEVSNLSFWQTQTRFEVVGATLPISIAQGDSVALPLRFTPQIAGAVTDSLYIHNNSQNMPIAAIRLSGTGEYVPPKAPGNVMIAMDGSNALISWDAVTQTIFDTPIVPDYYLIFFNGSADPDGVFYYHGASMTLQYTHYLVGMHSAHMFYRVIAFKNYPMGRVDQLLSDLQQGMAIDEVVRILNRN